MRWSYLKTGWMMTTRALLRSRLVLLLLFIIPTLFYALIILTTKTDTIIAFKLASIESDAFVQVSQRYEALIFIGLTAVGLLTSFLALNLIQKHAPVNRRLVLCGYRPSAKRLRNVPHVEDGFGRYRGGCHHIPNPPRTPTTSKATTLKTAKTGTNFFAPFLSAAGAANRVSVRRG